MTNASDDNARFVDEHLVVHEGTKAERLIAEQPAPELLPEVGLVQVAQERWQEAQRYERRTWMEQARRSLSDRNEDHRKGFEGYKALDGLTFDRGIELGCGPFTNIRLILERCKVNDVHLLDPLIDDYLSHPFCKYRQGRFGGVLNTSVGRLPAYVLRPGSAIRSISNDWRIGRFRGRAVTLHTEMIEGFSHAGQFDLAVMINVIEHCQDAREVLAAVNKMIAPGGFLVFHDKLYDVEALPSALESTYDAGHPLRVGRSLMERFFADSYETLFRAGAKSDPRDSVFTYESTYFIGRKLAH